MAQDDKSKTTTAATTAAAATTTTTAARSEHWKLFALPPFFTPQPAPATLARQMALWGALLLDHAAYYAARTATAGVGGDNTCALLRLYTCNSDVFYNRHLSRRLPTHAARAVLEALVRDRPNHAVGVTLDVSGKSSNNNSSADSYAVLVATVQGGYEQLERALLSWVLDVGGGGTTLAVLTRKGAVLTFNELVAGKCLYYRSDRDDNNNNSSRSRADATCGAYVPRTSTEAVLPVADVGALDEEQAIRAFLQALNHRATSLVRPYKITLFNLDGSNTQPYQGVKIGGMRMPSRNMGAPPSPPLLMLPASLTAWSALLRAALQPPLHTLWWPSHFHMHLPRTGRRIMPQMHTAALLAAQQRQQQQQQHDATTRRPHPSAVLVLLSPVPTHADNNNNSNSNNVSPTSLDVCITLTQRTHRVRTHKGHVSLPGGRVDGGESVVQAAQREAAEEVGVEAGSYDVLGQLAPVMTQTGECVATPVVGLASRALTPYRASPAEVAALCYVHLSRLLLHAPQTHARVRKSRRVLSSSSTSTTTTEPCDYPAFFASPSQRTPTPLLLPQRTTATMCNGNNDTDDDDGDATTLLPCDYPGKLVWGLTSSVLCELLVRLAHAMAQQQQQHGATDAHAYAATLLRPSNVLALDDVRSSSDGNDNKSDGSKVVSAVSATAAATTATATM